MRFLDLPLRRHGRFVAAIGGGGPPFDQLMQAGWERVRPLEITRSVAMYQKFIADSRADLGIAKHAYVASRRGWFRDRSTCYMAAGRPVLHQDTGFGDWLPVGDGVLSFSGMGTLPEAIDRLNAVYEHHALAARNFGEQHFDAHVLLRDMLERAGI